MVQDTGGVVHGGSERGWWGDTRGEVVHGAQGGIRRRDRRGDTRVV